MGRRREIDAILVWKLDRFRRSLADLVTTLNELRDLGVVFVSLTESLDLPTPSGRAMVGMLSTLAEFERDIIRERVKAGIANARENGKAHGRPKTAALKSDEIKKLNEKGWNNSVIARKLYKQSISYCPWKIKGRSFARLLISGFDVSIRILCPTVKPVKELPDLENHARTLLFRGLIFV
jgi:DNA invertase Pin-like site-specific DNA recombinase